MKKVLLVNGSPRRDRRGLVFLKRYVTASRGALFQDGSALKLLLLLEPEFLDLLIGLLTERRF